MGQVWGNHRWSINACFSQPKMLLNMFYFLYHSFISRNKGQDGSVFSQREMCVFWCAVILCCLSKNEENSWRQSRVSTLKEYGCKKKRGKYVNYVVELLFYIANWASSLNKTWEVWKTNFYLPLDHFWLFKICISWGKCLYTNVNFPFIPLHIHFFSFSFQSMVIVFLESHPRVCV